MDEYKKNLFSFFCVSIAYIYRAYVSLDMKRWEQLAKGGTICVEEP